ncbi:hypothetical protein TNCV_4172681 [Trichonephila clavipes]|nr:hypothetical protein TNCV_4172681 [Trichonephila clavipes]
MMNSLFDSMPMRISTVIIARVDLINIGHTPYTPIYDFLPSRYLVKGLTKALKFRVNDILDIASFIEMDTCSRIPSYDYPWQATFPKIMIHLKYEIKALTNLSITSHQHAPKKLTDEAKFMIFIISIFLILAAIGTVITAYDSYYRTKKKASVFVWLHGIRFIGAFWTLAIHVGLFYVNSLSDLSTSKVWRNHWSAPVFLNATCIISLFLCLGPAIFVDGSNRPAASNVSRGKSPVDSGQANVEINLRHLYTNYLVPEFLDEALLQWRSLMRRHAVMLVK